MSEKDLRDENDRLRKYAWYLAGRMQDQAMVINKKITTPYGPIIAASILDDLDDAASIAKLEPREWDGTARP